jgi:hypothetical protein
MGYMSKTAIVRLRFMFHYKNPSCKTTVHPTWSGVPARQNLARRIIDACGKARSPTEQAV